MYLRQSTASQEILLGPFLDDTDGKTAETGLTIANTDIKLWKGGATSEANKNSGGATHIAAGRYYAVLDATDTNTVGMLEVNVHVSGALPVRRAFYVLEEAVYDALFAASAAGYSTLTQTQVTGGAYALNSASFAFNSGLDFTTTQKAATLARVTTTDGIGTGGIVAGSFASNAITDTALANSAVVEIQANLLTATALNLFLGGLYLSGDGETTIGDTGNDTTHLHLPEVSHPDDELNGLVIVVRDVGDTNARVVRRITDWVASTQLATLDSALPFTPQDQVDTYFILSVKDTGALATAANLATAQGNITDILADTNELQTNQGNWLTATDVNVVQWAGEATSVNANNIPVVAMMEVYDAAEDSYLTLSFNAGALITDLYSINGTTFTEGGAGRLAGAFSTFFNVADPSLTTASVNQTGDSYALANGANGFVAIKGDSAAIKAKTDNLPASPAATGDIPSAAAISTQVNSDLTTAHGSGSYVTATGYSTHSANDVVTALGTGSSLTAVKLASDGLDSISTTAPTGVASNFREMLVAVWRRFFKRTTKSTTQIITYADDGETPITTQAITSVGDDQEQGAAT
jgi:hypothetical protein